LIKLRSWIGAGTGGATKQIIPNLGQSFSSYTFTDISSGFFEKASLLFREQSDRMIYKVLDAEKDIKEQGFAEGSHDMIICSLVLHATRNLQYTLSNVRRLLKPGGYLVMLEVTNPRPMRMGFSMSGMSGWWLGKDDGRELSPCVSATKWNSILRSTGYSGIDTITPEIDNLPRPFGVIVAQAIDERVSLIRQPLSSKAPEAEIEELVIVGGLTLQTSMLADNLETLLKPRCGMIRRVETMEQLKSQELAPMRVVLSMTELDEPIFTSMTVDSLEALKTLFDRSRNVLWITQGCRDTEPYANMTVGFGRTLRLEMPHVRLQFLDLDANYKADAGLLAECLLRLQITDAWEREGNCQVLWKTEPELAVNDGLLMVPRIIPHKDRNNRYSSSRRRITAEVSTQDHEINLSFSGTSYSLETSETHDLRSNIDKKNCITVRVSHSTMCALGVASTGFYFVVLGSNADTGATIIGLSESQASVVDVPERFSMECDVPVGKETH
jgi:hybrid polyketide synthase / nonribosomal peptide synthetase ACE1